MEDLGWNVWTLLRSEFKDFTDLNEFVRTCFRIAMAILLGGLLGYERESHGKAAGMRTHMLVAVGSAMFVLVPLQAGTQVSELTRVLQGIVTGIGFLGAGTIMKLPHSGRIQGLTTAASIWLTAAVGVAAGMGRLATASIMTAFALFILAVLRKFTHEHHLDADETPGFASQEPGKQSVQTERRVDASSEE